jgi:hypothetical protein
LREYYPKYSEVPKDVYEQVKALLRGYDRLKKERLDLIYGSKQQSDGMPRGSGVSLPTEQKAIKLAYIESRLEAVDQSAVFMRGKYSEKVNEDFDPVRAFWSFDYFNYQHIRKNEDDEGPVRKTWTRYRFAFAGIIAKRLNIF